MSTLVVVYELEGNGRKIVSDALNGAAETIYLPDLDDAGRVDALRNADAVLARTTRELRQGEIALLTDALLWAILVVVAMASAGAFVVRSLFRRTLAAIPANCAITKAMTLAGAIPAKVSRECAGDGGLYAGRGVSLPQDCPRCLPMTPNAPSFFLTSAF